MPSSPTLTRKKLRHRSFSSDAGVSFGAVRKTAVAIIASALLAACAQGATTATELVARIDVGARGACSVAFEAGAAWATVFSSNEVVRIDPATNAVTHRIPTDGGPCGITAGAGALWVMTNSGNTVQRIDPATGSVTASIPVGPVLLTFPVTDRKSVV